MENEALGLRFLVGASSDVEELRVTVVTPL